MFRRLTERGEPVSLTVEGRTVTVRRGESVAAALLAAGLDHCRTTPVSGAPRAPYCMMGVCFECLVVIDDLPNQQACLVQALPGMRVSRQCGAAALDSMEDIQAEDGHVPGL